MLGLVRQKQVSRLGQLITSYTYPDSKVHGANMAPIWGRQDPGGPRVGPMNFAIWVLLDVITCIAVSGTQNPIYGFCQ